MMNSVFKNTVWLVLMLMFCLPPAFAVDSKDYTAATPTSDFIDNNDGTVTHKKTGLTWMRCSMGQTWTGSTCSGNVTTYNWDEAMALKSDFSGKKDWRLPNIDELLSIVDKGKEKPAINSSIFPNTPFEGDSGWACSSSPYAYDGNNDNAWIVHFGYGGDNSGNKGYSYAVRLVRAGQWFSGFLEKYNKEEKKAALKAKKEAARNEREHPQREDKENSIRICKAQKQTCMVQCDIAYPSQIIFRRDCRDKCEEISCN